MDVLGTECADIDDHKRTVVACGIVLTDNGDWLHEGRSHGITTGPLLRLSDWLAMGGCTHAGLKCTGE